MCLIKRASLDTLGTTKSHGLIPLSHWFGKSMWLGSNPVAMHKKNTVHSGVIESCKNGESLSNFHFAQFLLYGSTKSKFKISKLVIQFRRKTGPYWIKNQPDPGPDQTRPDIQSGPITKFLLKLSQLMSFHSLSSLPTI
jgi:hypothetical protein